MLTVAVGIMMVPSHMFPTEYNIGSNGESHVTYGFLAGLGVAFHADDRSFI